MITTTAKNHNAMLYRFLQYHKEHIEEPENSIEKLKYRFKFIYDISRNLEPKDDKEKDWRTEKPSLSLLIIKNIEEQSTFKYLPVGVTISTYKKRSNKQIEEV